MLNVLIRPTSLMGLAGAPAEAVKPYEAKLMFDLIVRSVEEGFVEPKAERLKPGLTS